MTTAGTTGNAPRVPWFKHWQSGTSTPPRERVKHFGWRLARAMARDYYNSALVTRGPDHPSTRAALGRLMFYAGYVPEAGAASIESIAWHRESGAQGYRNRARRRQVVQVTAAGEGT